MRPFIFATILIATFVTSGFAQNTPKPGIEVEMDPQNPMHLRVKLTSGAATTVTLYRSHLPWGYRYSMIFAAVKPNGDSVDLLLPVADPVNAKVSLQAGATLTGDIDLQYVIQDLNVLKKSDILLFWAYKSPNELHIPHWSGGLIVIPQRK